MFIISHCGANTTETVAALITLGAVGVSFFLCMIVLIWRT